MPGENAGTVTSLYLLPGKLKASLSISFQPCPEVAALPLHGLRQPFLVLHRGPLQTESPDLHRGHAQMQQAAAACVKCKEVH